MVTSGSMGAPSATAGSAADPGDVQRLSKGIRITGAGRETLTTQVRARYEKGEPIRSIASSLGRSYGFIHRLLVEDQVPLRARGGPTRGDAARRQG